MMRKLIGNTFVTLDGVMQAPGGPEEDSSGGFTSGGWSVNYWDDTMSQIMGESMTKPFDLLLGRKTYEIFAAYWPHANEEQVATLVLGGTERDTPVSEDDLILLDDLADRLGEMIHATWLQEENTRLLSQMMSDFRLQEHALQRQADSIVSVSL